MRAASLKTGNREQTLLVWIFRLPEHRFWTKPPSTSSSWGGKTTLTSKTSMIWRNRTRCWSSRVWGAARDALPKILIIPSFCNCAYVRLLSQFVRSRRPKGTARQTTLLTAAFTQTAKAARCRPSTGAPTPALNRSRMSLPTGRSCAESPARCCQARVLQTDSLFLCPPASCLHSDLRAGQVTSWRLCKKRFQPSFSLQASVMSILLPPPPPSRPQREAVLKFLLCFWNILVTINNQHIRLLKHYISWFLFLFCW